MDKQDILRMAGEAGWMDVLWKVQYAEAMDCIDKFTALVAAAAKAEEREACAKVCESFWGRGYRDDGSDAWMGHDNAVQTCAAAIRARQSL